MSEELVVVERPKVVKNGDIVNGKVVDMRRDKQYRNPLSTVLLLFNSRRFLVLIVTILVTGLITLVPELAALEEQIGLIVIASISLILGLSAEDAITAWKQHESTIPDDFKGLVEETAFTAIETLLDQAFAEDEDVAEDEESTDVTISS